MCFPILHVVTPEEVVGDDGASRVNDRDRSVEREPFVALEVEKGRESMREPGNAVRIGERASHDHWSRRNVRAWSAGTQHAEHGSHDHAQSSSQDDAPLCFRHLEGYYSSGRPGASISGWFDNIPEGQCASRARLRITQCKRST